jgi:MOSC domain-containing protein YiiM
MTLRTDAARMTDESLFGTRTGRVERIHVSPEGGGEPEPRESVAAVAGRGLEGDRYYRGEGVYNERDHLDPSDLTLIEAEALSAAAAEHDVEFDPGAHRRNVTTRGVALNHLVGERFRVGDAVVEGEGLCEPCGYMQDHADEPRGVPALKHRGGLDARIVESGTLAVGDDVVW